MGPIGAVGNGPGTLDISPVDTAGPAAPGPLGEDRTPSMTTSQAGTAWIWWVPVRVWSGAGGLETLPLNNPKNEASSATTIMIGCPPLGARSLSVRRPSSTDAGGHDAARS